MKKDTTKIGNFYYKFTYKLLLISIFICKPEEIVLSFL